MNDIRGKAPEDASQAGAYPPGQYYAAQDEGAVSQPNGEPGTPTKQGQPMAPSVVISPSAPVSSQLQYNSLLVCVLVRHCPYYSYC